MTEFEELNEELASAFIVSTCQLRPKAFSDVSDQMHDLRGSVEPVPNEYSIMCGSMAEFYIRPLNTCVSDTDFLVASAEQLGFSDDFPVLPTDLSGLADTIVCYKIESYHKYPGFVRLRDLGVLRYNWKYKKYDFKRECIAHDYKRLEMSNSLTWHYSSPRSLGTIQTIVKGPAIVYKPEADDRFGGDLVGSLWCPEWPKEAQDWPNRQRNYSWPTIATISNVVRNGCHVVYVQHRDCRNDRLHWRFSFSVAEVILLQSWTPVQQIVYHLLRFFAKRELIQKDCPKEDEVLCPYHLKTLMLWTCEEMSREWWNSSSVIAVSCELLKKLSQWIMGRYFPNYFIPEANLFHEPSNPTILDSIERHLNKFCYSRILCSWFVENYIELFTRTHVDDDEVKNERKARLNLVDLIQGIFEARKASVSKSLDGMLYYRFSVSHLNSRRLIKSKSTSGLREDFNVSLHLNVDEAQIDGLFIWLPAIEDVLCFTYYDHLLHILHTAYGIGFGEISWDSSLFVKFIRGISLQTNIVRSQYHNFPKPHTNQGSQFQFHSAKELLKNLSGSNSRSEFQLLSLMSKEFLRRALKYEDSKFNGIAPAALTYLAALHFATSDYQQAVRFCLVVLMDHSSLNDKEYLNAGCLLFIDDVARIVGLCILYKMITNILHYLNRRLYLDLRLSPKVFAHYLAILSTESIGLRLKSDHNLLESAFPMDEYLKMLIKSKCVATVESCYRFVAARQIVYRRTDLLGEADSTFVNPLIVKETVIDILLEYALEHMASFYNVLLRDFGIQCSTVNCYRALYLYKCREYDEVLQICEQILQEPGLQKDLKTFAFANVLLLPPLDSFFDVDVQFVLGFHTMFNYLSPLNGYLSEYKLTTKSSFAHWFALEVYFNGFQISDSISEQNSIKRYYFLGRHFLAKYLKVRCYIDCNLPHTSEAMTEFASLRTRFPFEHVIRRYFLSKHRRIMKN